MSKKSILKCSFNNHIQKILFPNTCQAFGYYQPLENYTLFKGRMCMKLTGNSVLELEEDK